MKLTLHQHDEPTADMQLADSAVDVADVADVPTAAATLCSGNPKPVGR